MTALLDNFPADWVRRPAWAVFRPRKLQGHPDLPLLSVYRDHGVVLRDSRDDNHNRAGVDLSVYQVLKPGEVVMNKMKAWQGSIAVSEHLGLVSPDYMVLEVQETEAVPRFLHYLLRSPAYVAEYARLAYGVRPSQWRLMYTEFRTIPIFLPKASKQNAIAAFLDEKTAAIDALIETQQRLLDLLAEKRAALINRAVTRGLDPDAPLKDSGVPWIGEIPAHWEIRRLKSLASFTTSGSRGWAEFYTDDESKPLFLQSGNIGRTLDLDLSTVQHVDPPSGAEGVRTQTVRDDILVCITGARTGAVCLVDRELHVPAYINQHVALVRLRDSIAQSSFIAAALSADPGSHHFQMVQYGGTKQGLGLEDVRDVVLAVPPRAEQASISAVLREATRSIDAAAKEARGAIDRLQEYRQSLITAAVTGQLDIR